MVDLTLNDYGNQYDDGNLTLPGQLADIATDVACNIWYKSPGSLVTRTYAGNPIMDGFRSFYDGLCAPRRPVPPLPLPPFNGGQCVGKSYNVAGTYLITGNPNTQPFGVNGLEGKIGGVSVRLVAGSSPAAYAVFVSYGVGSTAGTRYRQVSGIVPSADGLTSPRITSITTDAAGGDNCGNIETSYPVNPLVQTDVEFVTNINVSPSINIPVNVRVVPTLVNNNNIFKPEFNVQIGDIVVNISTGGFTFSPTLTIPPGDKVPTNDPRTNPPPPVTIFPPPLPDGGQQDIQDIKDRIDDVMQELEDCCEKDGPPPPPENSKITVVQLGTGKSGDFAIPSGAFKVTLQITDRPTSEKIQFGENGPDTVYAGWAWFGDGLGYHERMPVDSDVKVYATPDRIGNRFAYTLYNGYSAIIRAYTVTQA